MKFEDVYKQWIDYKRRQVKESTMCAYLLSVKNHLLPSFNGRNIETITRKDLQNFIYDHIDAGLSPKSCKDIVIVMKMIMNYASEEMDIPVHTVKKLTYPTANKEGRKTLQRYTSEEYRKIVSYAIENPSSKNLGIAMTISSGMRIGEICALQWQDVDIENKLIHINKTIERIYYEKDNGKMHTKLIFSTPKTISAKRSIPILKELFPMVKKFAALYKPEYFVCSCNEKPIEPRTYRNYYTEYILKKAKLSHLTNFHGMRHTFASLMIESKVDPKTVSSILGHSDISTTLDLYVHPTEENKRNSINAVLGKFLK